MKLNIQQLQLGCFAHYNTSYVRNTYVNKTSPSADRDCAK